MRTRGFLKNLMSVLLMAAGLCDFVMTFIIAKSRENAVNTSRSLMIAAAIAMIVYSLIYLISGIIALTRRNVRKAAKVRPFVLFGVIVSLAQVVISTTNGIIISHLVIIAISGIAIPVLFFLLVAATSN